VEHANRGFAYAQAFARVGGGISKGWVDDSRAGSRGYAVMPNRSAPLDGLPPIPDGTLHCIVLRNQRGVIARCVVYLRDCRGCAVARAEEERRDAMRLDNDRRRDAERRYGAHGSS
jgi:hypothetical protein